VLSNEKVSFREHDTVYHSPTEGEVAPGLRRSIGLSLRSQTPIKKV
jgi:hypothetical protein